MPGPAYSQEPFSILPLNAIADTILTNVRELMATHSGAAVGQQGGGNGAGKPISARDMLAQAMVTANGNNGSGNGGVHATAAVALAN